MSTVKAKMQCNSIVDLGYALTVSFNAVYGTAGENESFSKATPFGNLNLTVDKETLAAKEWKRGEFYYISIDKAPSE